MMNPSLYWVLLFASCGYAFYRGGDDERRTAAICLLATVFSVLVSRPLAMRYAQVEQRELVVDLLTLLLLVVLAMRSPRFFPLWIAALQLTTISAHFLKGISIGLVPVVYAAAERFWSYPILVILIIATWRGAHPPPPERSADPDTGMSPAT